MMNCSPYIIHVRRGVSKKTTAALAVAAFVAGVVAGCRTREEEEEEEYEAPVRRKRKVKKKTRNK